MTGPCEIVESNWPFDGPHSDETVASAAVALGRLARYLANATQHRPETGASLYRIVSGLAGAAARIDEVLGQLAEATSGPIADQASLYDERHDRPGADTAVEVAILLRGVLAPLRRAASGLQAAAGAASHLGNEERGASDRCPRCDSPAPHLHPAVQFEGEVQPCSHPFHAEASQGGGTDG